MIEESSPKITAVVPLVSPELPRAVLDALQRSPFAFRILTIRCPGGPPAPTGGHGKNRECLDASDFQAGETVSRILDRISTPYLLWFDAERPGRPVSRSLERWISVAEATAAGMVYGDGPGHPVNDWQLGSIRDTFDFGPLVLLRLDAVRKALQSHGPIPRDLRRAGFYDLRLKLSLDSRLFHLPEVLWEGLPKKGETGRGHFAYCDPRNRDYQLEMEAVATDHLKRLGAYLSPGWTPLPPSAESFPCEASVVIPVRNRAATVGEAVSSALSQRTDFPFNVLAVDNHSTDGTTVLLEQLSSRHARLRHIVPARRDLGIGGCWQEAIDSPECGRFAVQLDSDDLYASPHTLQRLVEGLRGSDNAMVIGSYTIVDEALKEIPPGLIDHREWTDGNGRNNALRINGLGAPRAFRTDLLRRMGFPNVSYGEDYAAALAISRRYRIGRIYDSLYLCRRWRGNTDAALSVEQANRNDAYKDTLRTLEILARQRRNDGGG